MTLLPVRPPGEAWGLTRSQEYHPETHPVRSYDFSDNAPAGFPRLRRSGVPPHTNQAIRDCATRTAPPSTLQNSTLSLRTDTGHSPRLIHDSSNGIIASPLKFPMFPSHISFISHTSLLLLHLERSTHGRFGLFYGLSHLCFMLPSFPVLLRFLIVLFSDVGRRFDPAL